MSHHSHQPPPRISVSPDSPNLDNSERRGGGGGGGGRRKPIGRRKKVIIEDSGTDEESQSDDYTTSDDEAPATPSASRGGAEVVIDGKSGEAKEGRGGEEEEEEEEEAESEDEGSPVRGSRGGGSRGGRGGREEGRRGKGSNRNRAHPRPRKADFTVLEDADDDEGGYKSRRRRRRRNSIADYEDTSPPPPPSHKHGRLPPRSLAGPNLNVPSVSGAVIKNYPPTPRTHTKKMKVFTSLNDLSQAIQKKKDKQHRKHQRAPTPIPSSPSLTVPSSSSSSSSTSFSGPTPPTLPKFKHEVVLYDLDFTAPIAKPSLTPSTPTSATTLAPATTTPVTTPAITPVMTPAIIPAISTAISTAITSSSTTPAPLTSGSSETSSSSTTSVSTTASTLDSSSSAPTPTPAEPPTATPTAAASTTPVTTVASDLPPVIFDEFGSSSVPVSPPPMEAISHISKAIIPTPATPHPSLMTPPAIASPLEGLHSCSSDLLDSFDLSGAYLVGDVKLPPGVTESQLIDRGAVIIKPKPGELPFNPLRSELYTVDELRKVDETIRNWAQSSIPTSLGSGMGGIVNIRERVLTDLHDSQMLSALRKHVKGRFVVGVMGGHTLSRTDPMYTKIAVLCQRLARKGFLVVSGGGPGAMEAANLGAFLAFHNEEELLQAINMLQANEHNIEPEWYDTESADKVLEKYGPYATGENSLAVPSFYYCNDPFTRFAPHQAKFISTLIRDDILMHICNCGIIYAPGGAGTRTQIFQYAVPNAYALETKENFSKPMIFFGVFWLESGVFQSLLNVAQKEDAQRGRTTGYSTKLHCVEHPTQVLQIISSFKQKYYDSPQPPPSSHLVPQTPSMSLATPRPGSEEPPETRLERAKRLAAEKAVNTLVTNSNMRIGIGSGSTMKYVIDRLNTLAEEKKWNLTCVPASISTREALRKKKNLTVRSLLEISHVHLVIDGTNELDIVLNQIKGSGGALLQEKVLASSADQFVIVADERKDSKTLGARRVPVPIEVQTLAYKRVRHCLMKTYGIEVHLRKAGQAQQGPFVTDNSNMILDAHFNPNHLRTPASLEAAIKKIPGVLEVGIFCGMVSRAYVGNFNGSVHERVRTQGRGDSTAVTVVSNETQQMTLETVLKAVRNTPKAVVEVGLGLTALAPFDRTIKALQQAGLDYGITELQDPQRLVGILPGYTLEAWNAWVDGPLQSTGILEKYTTIPIRAEGEEFAHTPFGEFGATVWSSFNIEFWKSNDMLVHDIPVSGIAKFESLVRESGGTLVFLSESRTNGQLTASKESLLRCGVPVDHLHIEVADENLKPAGRSKKLHEFIQSKYGTSVALFDDDKASIKAATARKLIAVATAIPGFSSAPFVATAPYAISTFEVDSRDLDLDDVPDAADPLFEFVETSRVRNLLAQRIAKQPTFSEESLHLAVPIAKPVVNYVRIGTFNVENLFSRFQFKGRQREHSWGLHEVKRAIADNGEKEISALAIRKLNADILALQEVEDALTLDLFIKDLLPDCGYEHRFLIEGNDPRGIDVAIVSRYPVVHIRSYRHEKNAKGDPLFSRDCLEVKVECPSGSQVSLYINHLKSMVGSRDNTEHRRKEQVDRILGILRKNHGDNITDPVVVLGDFNDYIPETNPLSSPIAPLVFHKDFENVVSRLPPEDRWTHFWQGEDEYKQLDYLLISKPLAQTNPTGVPIVIREGQPRRAARYTGKRFPGVGIDSPKASDHCPIAFDVIL